MHERACGMWQPEAGGTRSPGAAVLDGRCLDGRCSATSPWSSSGSARPAADDPRGADQPAPLRLLAPRRRRHDRGRRRRRPRDCGPPAWVRSRRTTRASPYGRSGSRTPPAAGSSPRTRWAGSPARTSPPRPGWRATSCRPARARREVRRLADPRADHGRRRGRPPLEPAGGAARAVDALAQVSQHGDAVPANLPGRADDDVVAIDWSTLGTGPVGADLGYFALQRTRGVRAAAGRLPAGHAAEGLATREEARSAPG